MNNGWCIVESATGYCWTCPAATRIECEDTAALWCVAGIECEVFPYRCVEEVSG